LRQRSPDCGVGDSTHQWQLAPAIAAVAVYVLHGAQFVVVNFRPTLVSRA
jgi:hypothetical protein